MQNSIINVYNKLVPKRNDMGTFFRGLRLLVYIVTFSNIVTTRLIIKRKARTDITNPLGLGQWPGNILNPLQWIRNFRSP